jgi:hypothetical protein
MSDSTMGFFQVSSLSLLYVATFGVAALACVASLTRLQRITDPDTRRGLRALLLTSGGWATAHIGFLVSPSSVSYLINSHADEILSPQFRHRPSFDASLFTCRGMKASDVCLPEFGALS